MLMSEKQKQPFIDILLAAYQGQENFTDQLNSIFTQTYKNYSLIIRDDDSTNNTVVYAKAFPDEPLSKINIINDSSGQLGVLGNFSRLLAESESDYIMFCDQDDVWNPEKIEKTLAVMLVMEKEYGEETPLLVHTDLKVVAHNLEVISESLWKYQNIHPRSGKKFSRLLVQNVISGCTVMINKPLRDLAMPIPEGAVMYDWWLALVASAFGKIGHVDQATMLYRQHNANTIGAKRWGLPFVLKNVLGHDGQVRERILTSQKQARVFLETYQDKLPEDVLTALECYAYIDQQSYLKKVYLLIKHRLFKVGLIRNFGLWFHI
jgi:glycosyltransferase involved in cell wall biosynthesis